MSELLTGGSGFVTPGVFSEIAPPKLTYATDQQVEYNKDGVIYDNDLNPVGKLNDNTIRSLDDTIQVRSNVHKFNYPVVIKDNGVVFIIAVEGGFNPDQFRDSRYSTFGVVAINMETGAKTRLYTFNKVDQDSYYGALGFGFDANGNPAYYMICRYHYTNGSTQYWNRSGRNAIVSVLSPTEVSVEENADTSIYNGSESSIMYPISKNITVDGFGATSSGGGGLTTGRLKNVVAWYKSPLNQNPNDSLYRSLIPGLGWDTLSTPFFRRISKDWYTVQSRVRDSFLHKSDLDKFAEQVSTYIGVPFEPLD